MRGGKVYVDCGSVSPEMAIALLFSFTAALQNNRRRQYDTLRPSCLLCSSKPAIMPRSNYPVSRPDFSELMMFCTRESAKAFTPGFGSGRFPVVLLKTKTQCSGKVMRLRQFLIWGAMFNGRGSEQEEKQYREKESLAHSLAMDQD